MSVTLVAPVATQRDRPLVGPVAMLVLLGGLASFAFSWHHLAEVWRTGTFFDTDDAMRLVQVRAWLSGQAWFDMTATRLHPPAGVFMHWSRIVDVPLGLLIRVCALFTSIPQAELLTRIVFPLSLQMFLVAAFLNAARALCGPSAIVPALLLIVLSGFQFGQFVAGRIDHHAPQITLLVTMTGAFVWALRGAGSRQALVCAACVAASLGISLENLPFIAVLIAAAALVWIRRGDTEAPFLKAFGIGIALFVPVVFAATVSPSRYLVVAGDALSAPHVLLAFLGGIAFAWLAQSGRVLSSASRRAAAASLAGVAVVGLVLVLFPEALTSPYTQVDPVVRDVWLSRVTEALPLPATLSLHPQALILVLPLLAGLAGTLWTVFSTGREERVAWLVVAALTIAGLAGAMWEVRVISSVMPIALLGGVVLTTRMLERAVGSSPTKILKTCALILPFTPFGWLLMPLPEELPSVAQATERAAACREASALAPLARLPQGIVFAPIDAGSHLLVHTPHAVVAAPYHRNNAGNRAVIDGFSASPAQAEDLVKATGARYVALCPGEVQAAALLAHAPDGLAADLLAGRHPPWLRRVPLPDTPYLVYSLE